MLVEPARAIMLLAVFAASVIAWAAAGELAWPARAFLALLVGPLPALAVIQARALADEPMPIPRVAVYLSSILSLWILAAIAFLAAITSGFTSRRLGLSFVNSQTVLWWTLLCLTAAGAIWFAGRLLGIREHPLLEAILPVTRREKRWFLLVSVTAGICEELVFRGFGLAALTTASGNVWFATLIGAGLFGMLHAYQGSVGVARTAALGFVLSLPVLMTGSIIPGIVAHTVIDMIGGWFGRRMIAE